MTLMDERGACGFRHQVRVRRPVTPPAAGTLAPPPASNALKKTENMGRGMIPQAAADRSPDDAELARRVGERDGRAFEIVMRHAIA